MPEVVVRCLHHFVAVGLLGSVSLADGVGLCAHALALVPHVAQPLAAQPCQHKPRAATSKLVCQVLRGEEADSNNRKTSGCGQRKPSVCSFFCLAVEQGLAESSAEDITIRAQPLLYILGRKSRV